ncbi:unnamed protein product, partial [Oppiella nova]
MASIATHRKQKRKDKQTAEPSLPVPQPHSSPKKAKLEDKSPDIALNEKAVAVNNSNATLGWPTDDLNTLINNLGK